MRVHTRARSGRREKQRGWKKMKSIKDLLEAKGMSQREMIVRCKDCKHRDPEDKESEVAT